MNALTLGWCPWAPAISMASTSKESTRLGFFTSRLLMVPWPWPSLESFSPSQPQDADSESTSFPSTHLDPSPPLALLPNPALLSSIPSSSSILHPPPSPADSLQTPKCKKTHTQLKEPLKTCNPCSNPRYPSAKRPRQKLPSTGQPPFFLFDGPISAVLRRGDNPFLGCSCSWSAARDPCRRVARDRRATINRDLSSWKTEFNPTTPCTFNFSRRSKTVPKKRTKASLFRCSQAASVDRWRARARAASHLLLRPPMWADWPENCETQFHRAALP